MLERYHMDTEYASLLRRRIDPDLYYEALSVLFREGYVPAGISGYYNYKEKSWIEEPESDYDCYEILHMFETSVTDPADQDP